MSIDDKFTEAQQRVKTLTTRPSNPQLLELYSLYKQGNEGDCTGKRPGMLKIAARAKFDAWAKRKGTSQEQAKKDYVALVRSLLGE